MSTTKYDVFTFLPKGLFEQVSSIALFSKLDYLILNFKGY